MNQLESVALSLCPEIADRIRPCEPIDLDEQTCRRELVGCILASQVPNRAAERWTSALTEASALADAWWEPPSRRGFEELVMSVLAGEHRVSRGLGRYRFFRSRAAQIAAARDAVTPGTIKAYFLGDFDALTIRRRLVAEIPGLGPKQASMLIRNLGISLDIAVLDAHVVSFMEKAELVAAPHKGRERLATYEQLETVFREYAWAKGFSPGCLDWAVWITMRASRELRT